MQVVLLQRLIPHPPPNFRWITLQPPGIIAAFALVLMGAQACLIDLKEPYTLEDTMDIEESL